MGNITHHSDYRLALAAIKQRIQSSQTRAVLAVNAELLGLYWDIGRQLDAWQRERAWGSAVVEQMAQDLQASYPGMRGFSRTSLFAMRQFYAFFSPQFEVVPQPVGQMPWGHVRTLLTKVKSVEQVLLYAQDGEMHTQTYTSPRIISRNTHGTGCTLSSAIACYLALGESLPDAVAKARAYIVQAIEQGKNVHTGQGHGPLNHGFAPVAMRDLGG